jgi:hypothetical protein
MGHSTLLGRQEFIIGYERFGSIIEAILEGHAFFEGAIITEDEREAA